MRIGKFLLAEVTGILLSFGLVLINRHQEAICDQDFVGIPKK